jgi:hypothetical protein
VDYRRKRKEHASIHIDVAAVERVESCKFLEALEDLTWSTHTRTVMKSAWQRLLPVRRLNRFSMGPRILKKLYSCSIESILTGCITAWYAKCTALDHKALQRVVQTAQYIIGAKLPAI